MLGSRNTVIFLVLALVFGAFALLASADWRPPGDDQGYAPVQPIAYSHRVHAGELGIDCLFCHSGARKGPVAGIPPTGLCMSCHGIVSSGFDALREAQIAAEETGVEPPRVVSDEIRKLYRALALDDELQPIPGELPRSIPWVRVHDMPEFVAFDHSVHVARGLACETCHGPVQTMDRVRQESSLSMGWCLDCHRSKSADPALVLAQSHGELEPGTHVSTDCAVCHY